MRKRRIPLLFIMLFIYVSQASAHGTEEVIQPKTPAQAVSASKEVVIFPETLLKLDGDSNVRKYSSTATKLNLTLKMDPPLTTAADLFKSKMVEMRLEIPVAALKSDSGKLDEHLEDALKMDQFPRIICSVKTYDIQSKSPDGSYPIKAAVELSIAGTTKTVPIDAVATLDDQKVRIKGQASHDRFWSHSADSAVWHAEDC
jgi:hypothetical protein